MGDVIGGPLIAVRRVDLSGGRRHWLSRWTEAVVAWVAISMFAACVLIVVAMALLVLTAHPFRP